jgi:hypothetical protein
VDISINALVNRISSVVNERRDSQENDYRSDYDLLYCVVSIALGVIASYAANQIPNLRPTLPVHPRRSELESILELLGDCDFELSLKHTVAERNSLVEKIEMSIPLGFEDRRPLSEAIVDAFFSSVE